MISRSIKEMEKTLKKLQNPKKHICIKVDFLKNDQIKIGFDKAFKFLKEIDVILHIAGGGYGLSDPLMNNEDINKLLSINLLGAIEINRLAVNKIKKIRNLNLYMLDRYLLMRLLVPLDIIP